MSYYITTGVDDINRLLFDFWLFFYDIYYA